MATGNSVSRKRRQKKRQQQRILVGSLAILILVVILILCVSLKSCGKKQDGNSVESKAVTTASQVGNDNTSSTQESKPENESQTTEITSTAGETTNAPTEAINGPIQPTTKTQSITNAGTTSKGNKIQVIDGVTYIDGVLIANKTYALPSTFVPTNPEVPVTEARSTKSLDKDLMNAYRKLVSDASAKGLNLYMSSGYRSYDYQVSVYNRYVSQDGKAMADTYSSRPGNSEHQTGLCFDLNSIDDSFTNTAEGKWVNDNCYKYGFCIRFPKGKDSYTGYQYESWHLRYVGEELATKLYNNGNWISLEEYFGITSVYPN